MESDKELRKFIEEKVYDDFQKWLIGDNDKFSISTTDNMYCSCNVVYTDGSMRLNFDEYCSLFCKEANLLNHVEAFEKRFIRWTKIFQVETLEIDLDKRFWNAYNAYNSDVKHNNIRKWLRNAYRQLSEP